MLHGIPVDVVNMAIKIISVANEMLPKPPLPHATFAFAAAGARIAIRSAQLADVIGQQGLMPIKQIYGEEVISARNKYAPLIGHGARITKRITRGWFEWRLALPLNAPYLLRLNRSHHYATCPDLSTSAIFRIAQIPAIPGICIPGANWRQNGASTGTDGANLHYKNPCADNPLTGTWRQMRRSLYLAIHQSLFDNKESASFLSAQ